jgi:large subunit ribosomal protein L4
MPKKQRRKALFGALTLKAKDSEIIGLENFPFEEIKTKNAVNVLKNLNLVNEKTLVVLSKKDEIIEKSFRNIPNVKYILVNFVNPYDLLTHKKVLFFEEAIKKLEEIFVK